MELTALALSPVPFITSAIHVSMEYRAHDDGIDSFGPITTEFSSNCSTSTRLCVKRIAGRRPASFWTESDAPPEKMCTRYGLIQLCGSLRVDTVFPACPSSAVVL